MRSSGESIHNDHLPSRSPRKKRAVHHSKIRRSVHKSNSVATRNNDSRSCADSYNQRKSLLRRQRRTQGFCGCGAVRVVGRTCCKRCLERSRKRRQEKVRDGCCAHTGKCRLKPLPNRRMCEKHLESAAANQKKYQNRMTTKGRCASCGRKLPPGRSWNCLRCKP